MVLVWLPGNQVSSEFYMREVMGLERSKLGVLAWDVAGMGITYMLLETLLYLTLVSRQCPRFTRLVSFVLWVHMGQSNKAFIDGALP